MAPNLGKVILKFLVRILSATPSQTLITSFQHPQLTNEIR